MSRSPGYVFSPLISDWFSASFPEPSPIQSAAWPVIQRGEHVLITSPTGTGKTLTAFLSAIDSLLTGRWETGATRVLYVSPLKALNSDIERNLRAPLQGIQTLAEQREIPIPPIRAAVRSGDTPSTERSRMVRHPPEILITTPESLNLILSSPRARQILTTVQTVILDEIHALVGSKRGTHLLSAVERLVLLAGEFQRIAISATVRPVDEVAAFVGGRRPRSSLGPDTVYERRKVVPIGVPDTKKLAITLHFPDTDEPEPDAGFWPHLCRELRAIIDANRSTLVFVNSRRHAEKIALMLNHGEDEPVVYSHHGSLSRELRQFVEGSLKEGRLRAIVATNSLELGIDIGALDSVVLVGTPPEVRSALQRSGRAGHQVGALSRTTILPVHGRDLIDAAVMTELMLDREIEETKPVAGPLDVLAQVIVSMTVVEPWDLDALYAAVRMCSAFGELSRKTFDLVIDMLAGRYAETSIRELSARVVVDRVRRVVSAAPSARLTLYSSGGTIPDRGYFALRTPGGSRIGELDEEFVWERRVGETFTLGSRAWTIEEISSRDVVVLPAKPGTPVIPFWRGLTQGRHPLFAERVLRWLEAQESTQAEPVHLPPEVEAAASEEFVAALTEFLGHQRTATGTPLPHRHHIVIERFPAAAGTGSPTGATTLVIHTLWGSRINAPLALALRAHLELQTGVPFNIVPTDDSLVVTLEEHMANEIVLTPERSRQLCRTGEIERLLRHGLESSNLFGALFRENAGRALLLPRGGFGTRTPLWLTRTRSKKIIETVRHYPDFPIMLETWRTCLEDIFALEALRGYLEEVASGDITVSTCTTDSPSPFAREVVWQNTNLAMYADDSNGAPSGSSLDDEALREVLRDESLRPRFTESLIHSVEQRLQRLAPGYPPSGPSELSAWLEERLALNMDELGELVRAVIRDHGESACSLRDQTHRFVWIHTHGTLLLASAGRASLLGALYPDAVALPVGGAEPWRSPPTADAVADARPLDELVSEARPDRAAEESSALDSAQAFAEVLRFYGPRTPEFFHRELGVSPDVVSSAVAELTKEGRAILGRLREGTSVEELCDSDVLEYLLRTRRRAARHTDGPSDPTLLVPFWARRTGVIAASPDAEDEFALHGPDRLVDVLEVLFTYPAPASVWERDLLPTRLEHYHPLWLDGLFTKTPLRWVGTNGRRLLFCLKEDSEFIAKPPATDAATRLTDSGPLSLSEYAAASDSSSEIATRELWEAVWSSEISNTGFEAVRIGVRSRFKPTPVVAPDDRRHARGGLRRGAWAASRPGSGKWYALRRESRAGEQADPLTSLEQAKETVRLLLSRYGVLYRTLLDRESPTTGWSSLFPALRLMELSGEIQGGLFLRGVSTPQFAETTFPVKLAQAEQSTQIISLNAIDPASPCGAFAAPAGKEYPPRVPGNHLVFRGIELVVVSRRQGRDLTVYAQPDDPQLTDYLAPLRSMLTRAVDPVPRVSVETINGVAVRESEFADRLLQAGFRDEFRSFVLSASYR